MEFSQLNHSNKLGLEFNLARITNHNHLILTAKNSNDLYKISNCGLGEIASSHLGRKEKDYGNILGLILDFDQFRSFRYAKEDLWPIWRDSRSSVRMMDPESNQELSQSIPVFENMPKNHEPMFCLYDVGKNQLIGYSIGEDSSIVHLCSLYPCSKKAEKIKVMKLDNLQKWSGIELSTDGKLLIVSCSEVDHDSTKEKFCLKAINISDGKRLQVVSSIILNEHTPDISSLQFMRKLKGYDLFFLACENSIMVVQFRNLEFSIVNYLEQVV